MPCQKVEHNHEWPVAGDLTIERCERFCAYCKGPDDRAHSWKFAWFLRRHVESVHIKSGEYPNVNLHEGWTRAGDGTTRKSVQKKKRAPLRVAKKATRGRQATKATTPTPAQLETASPGDQIVNALMYGTPYHSSSGSPQKFDGPNSGANLYPSLPTNFYNIVEPNFANMQAAVMPPLTNGLTVQNVVNGQNSLISPATNAHGASHLRNASNDSFNSAYSGQSLSVSPQQLTLQAPLECNGTPFNCTAGLGQTPVDNTQVPFDFNNMDMTTPGPGLNMHERNNSNESFMTASTSNSLTSSALSNLGNIFPGFDFTAIPFRGLDTNISNIGDLTTTYNLDNPTLNGLGIAPSLPVIDGVSG